MWITILQELGAKFNPYDYNGEENEEKRTGKEEDPSGLDPVPPDVIGCLDKNALRAAAAKLCTPLETTAAVAQSRQDFVKHVKPMSRAARSKRTWVTKWIFSACLLTLLAWGMLVPAAHMQIKCFAVFFTVAKSNGKKRTIYDCRALNEQSERPPPIALASMAQILEKAAELKIQAIVSADLSHWFHQMSLPDGVEPFFGFKCPGQEEMSYYMAKTWPMGFSWSCAVCGNATITMMLSKAPQEDDLGVDYGEVRKWEKVPPIIELVDKRTRQVKGFMVIYYDNVGIFLTEASDAPKWQRRMDAATRIFKCKWKESHILDARGLYDTLNKKAVCRSKKEEHGVETEERIHEITFLGVQMSVREGFKWRHEPSKLEKWLQAFEFPLTTPRKVSKVAGVLIWNTIVQLQSMQAIVPEINALRGVVKMVRCKRDWDKPFTRSEQDALDRILTQERLRVHHDALQENQWLFLREEEERPVVYLASDATETSIAGVMLNERAFVIGHFAKLDMKFSHIYVKEVLGVYYTVLWAQQQLQCQGPVEFRIAVDNKAAAAACQRCYSSNDQVNEVLVRLWRFLEENTIRLKCVDIHTKLNVADAPSRRRETTRKLARATLQVLQGGDGRPAWLYKGDATLPSEYLPHIEGVDVPDVEDGGDLWGEFASAHALKYGGEWEQGKRFREFY